MSSFVRIPPKRAILTVAVSSRALFHLEQENAIFENEGEGTYNQYMREHQYETLEGGVAFGLVRKLLALNRKQAPLAVEVVMLSRNSPLTGLRVMHSVREHGLDIEKAVFCRGSERFRYASALGADLFLSANPSDVNAAGQHGVASATIVPQRIDSACDQPVRIAFDGDSVLFDHQADQMFHQIGLERWREHERQNACVPLGEGPFKRVIEKLHAVREGLGPERHLVRLALVTARGAPTHERALRTLEAWGIEVDEGIFAAGWDKGPLLKAFGSDFFFDDNAQNIESANAHKMASGQVPALGRQE